MTTPDTTNEGTPRPQPPGNESPGGGTSYLDRPNDYGSGAVGIVGGAAWPQVSAPLAAGTRGIASLTHDGRTLRFRTNPNEFQWNYNLNKRIDQTYGGRVIQLLGINIEDFSFTVEAGGGRWEYMEKVVNFMRDVLVAQRNGRPATFQYTTRGWKLNCYISSFPFEDAVEAVTRPFTVTTKVQEDVSGVVSDLTLSAELQRLQDGMGFERSQYNTPKGALEGEDGEGGDNPIESVIDQANSFAQQVSAGQYTGDIFSGVFGELANRIGGIRL
ncbi:hypothetical protein SEA_SKOG_182 [Gordonia phage Skog]|uniref:Minor tail protein n=1 Tax=Gordonia phage Skog TaxID=2704033 RepID=A0A6G6XJZ3_9CAUD|nr:hypothetical protein KHQ85_gp182 [Gordonia phage Skog]QIG58334.1 hypothetical protein SEA_SKOG_182 [Gordonia phage Skog]